MLYPKLQNEINIHKWSPRSIRGQFLVVSQLHASNVGLVNYFNAGRLIDQFHVVYDSNFKTVNNKIENNHDIWREIITFRSFRSDYDDEDYVLDIDNELLTD